jgi:hypothetical protein
MHAHSLRFTPIDLPQLMSKMPPLSQKKRKLQDGMRGKTDRPKKRFRKQMEYHSSSEDSENEDGGFAAVDLNDGDDGEGRNTTAVAPEPVHDLSKSEEEADEKTRRSDSDENTGSEEDDDDEDASTLGGTKRKTRVKRNDPEAFSTSISKILSSKLSQAARKDPVLARSREATQTSASLANERLERKAKAKLRSERKVDLARGRDKDVLGLNSGQAGEIAEEEKKLRKIAQRGVVKLFNAVRAAQVKAEQAAKEERKKGTVGVSSRQEKVNEMSKQGFLDLIGGKKTVKSTPAPHDDGE